jgi:hypothetical protein
MSNQINTREQAVALINGQIAEYAHLLGLEGIQAIEKKCREEKKPFTDAVKDAVRAKFDVIRIAGLVKTGAADATILLQVMPKPALLLVAAELKVKGVSALAKDKLIKTLLASKNQMTLAA